MTVTLALGCEPVTLRPDRPPVSGEARLFSLARPDLVGLPAALSFKPFPRTVIVESGGGTVGEDGQAGFDVVLTENESGFVLAPPDALSPKIETTAAVALLAGREFEQVREAPADADAYSEEEPVPLRPDAVYVIRTRTGRTCARFAKLAPIRIDTAGGSVLFRYLLNPDCTRDLVPADEEGQ